MENKGASSGKIQSYRLAWTAYIVPMVVALLFGLISLSIAVTEKSYIMAAIFFIPTILSVLGILNRKSIELYTDDEGVWIYAGIFPWSKGVSGVRWRDIEDATYVTGFLSWIFKSYTIRVGHRFTKSSELILDSLYQGDQAAIHINELHSEKLASMQGAL